MNGKMQPQHHGEWSSQSAEWFGNHSVTSRQYAWFCGHVPKHYLEIGTFGKQMHESDSRNFKRTWCNNPN